jgi:hypothetical protein
MQKHKPKHQTSVLPLPLLALVKRGGELAKITLLLSKGKVLAPFAK